MKDFLWVGFGGFLGAVGRFSISLLFLKYLAEKPFYSTATVNLLGSFFIGLLIGYFAKLNDSVSLFLITGFCGGFTTFSTFSIDGIKLLRNELYMDFCIYTSLSVLGGLAVCALGFFLANRG